MQTRVASAPRRGRSRRTVNASFQFSRPALHRIIPVTMKRGRLLLALGLVLGSARVCRADHHVWSYLIAKLAADGIHRATAVEVFDDARVPTFTGLQFAPDRPHEAGGIEPVQESNDGTPKDEKSDA